MDNVLHVSHLVFFNAAPAVPTVQVKASLAPEITPGNQPQVSPAVLVAWYVAACFSVRRMFLTLEISESELVLDAAKCSFNSRDLSLSAENIFSFGLCPYYISRLFPWI